MVSSKSQAARYGTVLEPPFLDVMCLTQSGGVFLDHGNLHHGNLGVGVRRLEQTEHHGYGGRQENRHQVA
jgi:hypothetical protein